MAIASEEVRYDVEYIVEIFPGSVHRLSSFWRSGAAARARVLSMYVEAMALLM